MEKSVVNSFRIIGWINFIGDSARGVVLPILWPMCLQLGEFAKSHAIHFSLIILTYRGHSR